MFDLIKVKKSKVILCFVLLLSALVLTACAKTPEEADSTLGSGSSAVKGTLTVFDPAASAETSGGKQIEGSEEEELQQERIGGGAVGDGVVSENLEPLVGITDFSEGDFVNSYGIFDDPPAMEKAHKSYGADCLTCHSGGVKTEKTAAIIQQPPGHTSSKLTNDDCAVCHEENY